jgi:phosphopantothenoylcysteine decarboxylase/phosphopantothenate--cysteine ligase
VPHDRTHQNRRLLITAGPTHEPIDEVRYLANRSSGRLGIAIADDAARRGWRATILLGPTNLSPSDTRVHLHRFRTTADLERLLAEHAPHCDMLIMAAAVADYRPRTPAPGKTPRTDRPLTIELEPTPDLIRAAAARKRPDQVFVGFALEPRTTMLGAAKAKLERKGLDAVVANPLETMDAPTIDAALLERGGGVAHTSGEISKADFAGWLLDALETRFG